MAKMKISPPPNGEIMDVIMVAEFFGVGVKQIYRMAQEGLLPAFKIGETWRFSRSALVKWSEKQALNGNK